MIKSEKRKEKIRKLWNQGMGEKNICALEGISPEELKEVLTMPARILQEVPLTPTEPQQPTITAVHIQVLKAIGAAPARSVYVLSAKLGIPAHDLQVVINDLLREGLTQPVQATSQFSRFAVYGITESGLRHLQQSRVSA